MGRTSGIRWNLQSHRQAPITTQASLSDAQCPFHWPTLSFPWTWMMSGYYKSAWTTR